MSAGSFVAYRQDVMDPRHGPAEGVAWAKAIGGAQDKEMGLLRAAALARLPVYVPDDGLDACGVGFLLPRMAGETNASYRARLINAWPTYAEAGSAKAIVDALHAYGITDVRVVLEEANHGGAPSWGAFTSYAKGALVLANGNVYEQVGAPGTSGAGFGPTGQGQAISDGSVTWAWRCAYSIDANDPGYAGWWYSRFDVALGGQTAGAFGTTAVNKFTIANSLAGTSGSFTAPAVGGTVSVAVVGGSLINNAVIYVSQAGYYQVVGGIGPYTLQNLGDAAAAYAVWWAANHAAGAVFAPDTWGAPGQFPNATGTIPTGQQIMAVPCGIVGQTRIGIAIVDDTARQAIKSLILRWKATHGYAGRIALAYDGAVLDPAGQPGYHNGTATIGRMIGINLTIPFTIGGYDRS